MTPEQFWKNFNLLDEVSIAGGFVYNGLRRFREMKQFELTDELFDFFYNVSVGIERLLKVALILIEHDAAMDIEKFEESLRTHKHLDLLARVRKGARINLAKEHLAFLALLSEFYEKHRYNRFSASSVTSRSAEKRTLIEYLGRHLDGAIDTGNPFGIENKIEYKKLIRRVVVKIREEAHRQNLYTYELRHDSRAEKLFLAEANLDAENVAWQELVIYLVNTTDRGGVLDFIRTIPELEFDPALLQDCLESFKSARMNSEVTDFVETCYDDRGGKFAKERLQQVALIGDPSVYFDSDEISEDDSE